MRLRKLFLISALSLSFFVLGGCDKFPGSSAKSDGQILEDVKAHLNADTSVTNKQIDIGVKDGVVTLNGQVGSETERLAAANDASTVTGVKTVVNNLSVMTAAEPAKPSPAQPEVKASTARPKPKTSSMPSNVNAPVAAAPATQAAAPVSVPPKPPEPVKLTVPAGTLMTVRLGQALSSETNQAGDTFQATLDAPLTDGDRVVIPAHTTIEGRVVDAKGAAKFKGSSLLTLQLTRVTYAGQTHEIATDHWTKEGAGRGKNTAVKVGGGAAVGALIGGLIGGGKGAAIGAGVGAGAGTTAQAVTKGQKVELPSETVLTFHLESPLTVTMPANAPKNARETLPSDNN